MRKLSFTGSTEIGRQLMAEFAVLKALVMHAREPLTRDKLMNLARGREWDALERSIDVQISRLLDDAREPAYIKTVRSEGYVFSLPVEILGAEQ